MAALRKRARDAGEAEAPAAAATTYAVGEPALCDEGSDDDAAGDEAGGEEEEVVLPGADDPSFAEQYALWRERRFIDVWLQARPARAAAHAPTQRLGHPSASRRRVVGSRAPTARLTRHTLTPTAPGGRGRRPRRRARACVAHDAGVCVALHS